MSNSAIVSCQALSKIYREANIEVEVLKNLDFVVAAGERVAIVGESGSGKSTLLQLLGGLDKPTSGVVTVAHQDINALSEREKGFLRNQALGFVYQFHHLLPEFNALENVCIPLLVRGMQPKIVKEKALNYIERVGLSHRCNHRVGEISGGERQRIALARALVTEPRCVLADEPTGNLDQETAEHMADLIAELSRDLGISFVIVTHDRRFAKKMDRVLLLRKGQLEVQEAVD